MRDQRPPEERVEKYFVTELAVAWREAEIAGCKSPTEATWLAKRQEIREESLRFVAWPMLILMNQKEVLAAFKKARDRLQL